jgi:hypothetical protein
MNENYKTLKKEIIEESRRWKGLSYSLINQMTTRIDIKFYTIFTKIPIALVQRSRKHSKIHIEGQKFPNCQSNPDQKDQWWSC